jgi:rhodanese-related sulfurtransferase
MLDKIKNILGFGPKEDLKTWVAQGATILDVRTKGEYQGGHIKNSINIPLQELPNRMNKLSKDKPIITCCASGMRSASAKSLLLSNGFSKVYNGGGWASLQRELN